MAVVPLPAEKKIAGLSSMEALVAREPAFTHKRRVELANVRKDQVAHAVDFTGQRTDMVCICVTNDWLADSFLLLRASSDTLPNAVQC